MNHVLRCSEPKVGEEYMTAVLTAEDVLWFNVSMKDPMVVTVLDGRKHLQKCVANLVFLSSIVVGSNRGKEIATTVEVEDEKVPSEAGVDAVVTEAGVRIEGDGMGNVFMILDVLLFAELLG